MEGAPGPQAESERIQFTTCIMALRLFAAKAKGFDKESAFVEHSEKLSSLSSKGRAAFDQNMKWLMDEAPKVMFFANIMWDHLLDVSTKGHAVLESAAHPLEVREAVAHRERWRFREPSPMAEACVTLLVG